MKSSDPSQKWQLGDRQKRVLARGLLSFSKGEWFTTSPGSDAHRLLPLLLIGVYEASLRSAPLTKREACDLMQVERATTGPRYIQMAVDAKMITIERKPDVDKRKDFLVPTPLLVRKIELELGWLIGGVTRITDAMNKAHQAGSTNITEKQIQIAQDSLLPAPYKYRE